MALDTGWFSAEIYVGGCFMRLTMPHWHWAGLGSSMMIGAMRQETCRCGVVRLTYFDKNKSVVYARSAWEPSLTEAIHNLNQAIEEAAAESAY